MRKNRAARDTSQTLTIGEVAQMAGVNIQTVRYYEKRNLVPPPPRRPSGYRAYPLDTVSLIRFIKRAQEIGFSLKDIEDLLNLRHMGKSNYEEIEKTALEKLRVIEEKRNRLEALGTVLEGVVRSIRDEGGVEVERIVDAFDEVSKI